VLGGKGGKKRGNNGTGKGGEHNPSSPGKKKRNELGWGGHQLAAQKKGFSTLHAGRGVREGGKKRRRTVATRKEEKKRRIPSILEESGRERDGL